MRTSAKAILAAAAIATAGLGGLATPAAAQSSSGQQQQQQQVKTDWSDQKLQGFVKTAMAVREVYSDWRPKIKNAENKEEEKKLRKQANDEAVKVVKDSSLTVDTYTKINRAMRKDPEFYKKVRGMMQSEMQN